MRIKEDNVKVAEMATADMSIFAQRQVEIYRSADDINTGIYFGDDRETPAYFELVVFGYKMGDHQLYLRYPGSECYVEIFGGSGGGRGNMTHWSGRDLVQEILHPWVYEGKKQPKSLKVLKHDGYGIIQWTPDLQGEFNFLKRVAAMNFERYEKQPDYGIEFVKEMLSRKFVPIPDKRRIEYAFNTKDGNVVIVDASAYNYQYGTLRCHYGNVKVGIKEGKISDFQRYKDGGTTIFKVEVDGKVHEFFAPTRLGDNGFKGKKTPEWNEVEMVPMNDAEKTMLASQLSIDLAEEVERR